MRSSANRPPGTMEIISIDSIMQVVMRDYLIDKVLPAIRAKWLRENIGKPQYGSLSVLTPQYICLPFRAPNYIFLFETYHFFNLI
jgi:hypothetical protein